MSSEDPKPQIEEECAESHHCHGFKERLAHCNERFEEGKEPNCVEEFLDLMAGPKVFAQLK
ncbi:hypothetical protein DFJ73DRAFT_622968 [Zopfochytrium polystomum]|nr:hypothetical protein DFJ73DRAFT_622968 [Zopfochytrium polystomum]